MNREYDELLQAYKKNKHTAQRDRLHAVCMIKINGNTIADTARQMFCSYQSVSNWLEAYERWGIEGLKDLPRSGRPELVSRPEIEFTLKSMNGRITPKLLVEKIFERTGIKYSVKHMRKIMKKIGYSVKTAQMVHVNRAGQNTIDNFRHSILGIISCLESDGWTVLTLDEAFCIFAALIGKKYWSEIRVPIHVKWTGNHQFLTLFGAFAMDGRRFVRIYDKFNKETFLDFIKELRRHFGKIAVIMDRAPQHRSKAFEKFVRENDDVKAIYLPRGCPELNAAEQFWNMLKRTLLNSEYYPTFEDMVNAIRKYIRTTGYRVFPMNQLKRRIVNSNHLCV